MTFVYASMLSLLISFSIYFFTQLQIEVHVVKQGHDDFIRTRIMAWRGLIKIESEIPVFKIAPDASGTHYEMDLSSADKKVEASAIKFSHKEMFYIQHKLKTLFDRVVHLHRILKMLLKHIKVKHFEWISRVGTGDAASTGVVVGVGWNVKNIVAQIISTYFSLRTIPRMDVIPDFQRQCMDTEFKCMIQLRIGHAIIAGIRILLNYRKRRDTKWQNIPFKA